MGKKKIVDTLLDAGRKLDMSQAARIKRAREMGFDVGNVYYHGTADDIEAFARHVDRPNAAPWNRSKPSDAKYPHSFGVHLSNAPGEASVYASDPGGAGGGNVIPAFVRHKNPLVVEIPEGGPYTTASMFADYKRDQLIAQAKAGGHDAVIIRKTMPDDWTNWGGVNENVVVFDPANIRSINAAFDPDKADSSNILASLAGAGVLGALGSQQAEASPADYLKGLGYGAGNLARGVAGDALRLGGYFNALMGLEDPQAVEGKVERMLPQAPASDDPSVQQAQENMLGAIGSILRAGIDLPITPGGGTLRGAGRAYGPALEALWGKLPPEVRGIIRNW